jgi:lipid A 3-O-deacylase
MDGQLAAVFLGLSLLDMGANHCSEACFGRSVMEDRWSLSGGRTIFQDRTIGSELYARWDFGTAFGPFQPSVGLSATDDGSIWIGAGLHHTAFLTERIYYQGHLMPGLFARGGGPDLGSVLQFRSGIELGYEAPNGVRYGLSVDHRSNADIVSTNPGLETIQFRVSVPSK